ncbi:roadblock/LC7 domain-containing protein [Streptomyces lycii]|nr:roadblock/LC7 domain-containing protein [Streptomyces lycii]
MSQMTRQSRPDFVWLLEDLVDRVPHARIALLLSGDGLAMAAHGAEPDLVDKLAAVASGIHGLARTAGIEVADDGGVRQVIAELATTTLFVTTAAAGTRLLVIAGRDADPGVLGYETAALGKRVGTHVSTPARTPAQSAG